MTRSDRSLGDQNPFTGGPRAEAAEPRRDRHASLRTTHCSALQLRCATPSRWQPLDADVLVAAPDSHGLDLLRGIYEFCAAKGFPVEGEAIVVGAWPVQFVPAFDPLTWEAMEQADTADFKGVPLRVVRADHLGVIALSVGRPKDFARILALLESDSVSREEIGQLAARHGHAEAWKRFERRFLDE